MSSFGKIEVDILRPPMLLINRRNYRVLAQNAISNTTVYAEEDLYPEEEYQDEPDCSIQEGSTFEIEVLHNRKMRCILKISSAYYPFIIGPKGATKHRIENETNTQIRIPARGVHGDVVVMGVDQRTVRQASMKLELLVEKAKRRQPFTHFLSIPFTAQQIQERFIEFKKEVLEKCCMSRGVDQSLFQDPNKLHLTLCVFVLTDDRERQEAISFIQKSQVDIIEEFSIGKAMRLEVKGIEYMNDDPGEVDVLYAKVESVSWADDLQALADSLVVRLECTGIVQKQYEKVKLHITLMNTLFRRDADGTSDTSKREADRESFDAKQILQEFKDYNFGELDFNEIHLSVRYTTASSTGYYKASTKILLTE